MGQRGHHLPVPGAKAGTGDSVLLARCWGPVGPRPGARDTAGRLTKPASPQPEGSQPREPARLRNQHRLGNQHGAPLREALELPPRKREAAAARKRRGGTSRSCLAPQLPPAAAESPLRRQPPPRYSLIKQAVLICRVRARRWLPRPGAGGRRRHSSDRKSVV